MKLSMVLLMIFLLSGCLSTGKFYHVPVGQTEVSITLNSSDYDIIGEVEGFGEGRTYQQARDASLMNASKTALEADLLIMPNYSVEWNRSGFLIFRNPSYRYKVKCTAMAIKIK